MIRRLAILGLLAALALGCEREKREFQSDKAQSGETEQIAVSTLSPGQSAPVATRNAKAEDYVSNAYHLSEGKRLFSWYNCTGCHGNGGGGSGPALMDGEWRYGGRMENIVATIREGRPNGMPSFRGKVPDEQIWQLAAFVRSLSGNVPKDAAPSRNDAMNAHPAENRLPTLPPAFTGSAP
jgi:cytochrome c oxidase cbb3-type subunit 3